MGVFVLLALPAETPDAQEGLFLRHWRFHNAKPAQNA